MQKIGLEAVLEMSNFRKGMGDYASGIGQMEERTSRLGGILDGAGKAIAGIGIAAGAAAVGGLVLLAGGLNDCVREAMASEEAMSALNQVIASTGGAAGVTAQDAAALATQLQAVTRYSDEEIMAAETMLLQFETMNKETFPVATRLALDLAARLGTDAAGAARMLGKALAEPGEGLARLKAAGLTFTDQEEKMIKAMFEAGDVAGAQAAIMDKLTSSVGGAAEAAGETFAGRLDILKNQFSDIKEQIGMAILPSLTELAGKFQEALADPRVQQAIANVAQWLAVNLPLAIEAVSTWLTGRLVPAVRDTFTWIQENVVPILVRVYEWLATNLPPAIQALSNFWTGVLQPALSAVWSFIQANILPIFQSIFDWLATNLPPAIQALSGFWSNVLLPALSAVWVFIQESILPIFQAIFDWLSVVLPPVIQFLSDVWQNVLLPALSAVWSFIQTYLIPLFGALASVWIALVKKEVELLRGVWQNVLLPALQKVWFFIEEQVIPVLRKIAFVVKEEIAPRLTWFSDNIITPLAGAISAIGDAISSVINWLRKLAEAVKNIQLPDWLTPGSPTPFELGLRGIGDAVQELARMRIPELTVGMRALQPAYSPAGGMNGAAASMIGGASSTVTNNITLSMPTTINNEMDAALFQAQVLQTVSQAVQGY